MENLPNPSTWTNEETSNRLMNYITEASEFQHRRTQHENINEWAEAERELEEEEMDQGDRPMESIYSNFYTYQRADGTDLNLRYWEARTEDNSVPLTDYAVMPASMRRNHTRIDMVNDSYDDDHSDLQALGFTDDQMEYIREAIHEEALDRERIDGGFAYWESDNQRRPLDHPDAEFMLNELNENGALGDYDENLGQYTEGEDGEIHDAIYGEDPIFLTGFRTSEASMRQFENSMTANLDTMRQEIQSLTDRMPQDRQQIVSFVDEMTLPLQLEGEAVPIASGLAALPNDLPPLE